MLLVSVVALYTCLEDPFAPKSLCHLPVRASVSKTGLELGEELLTFGLLATLAVAWIAMAVPALLRARQSTPFAAAERWRHRLSLIAPRPSAGGRWVVVPSTYSPGAQEAFRRAQRRRLRLLVALAVMTGLGLPIAVVAGGPLWGAEALLGGWLATYVALLVVAKRRRIERRRKVTTLARRRPSRLYPEVAAGGHH